ncbi:hypothetical protein O181_051349 [Austropuccinia psidii MF-1]|uniref:Organic solute transporter Ostalpha-domain-containing protein n=1 Tax=Austropuccinia psidii MF-1 TaxID=1389203 RepID=A0A9Q3DYN0_9BASI|nr:hypothetical protein [Austropuccinia psidii MF-1]
MASADPLKAAAHPNREWPTRSCLNSRRKSSVGLAFLRRHGSFGRFDRFGLHRFGILDMPASEEGRVWRGCLPWLSPSATLILANRSLPAMGTPAHPRSSHSSHSVSVLEASAHPQWPAVGSKTCNRGNLLRCLASYEYLPISTPALGAPPICSNFSSIRRLFCSIHSNRPPRMSSIVPRCPTSFISRSPLPTLIVFAALAVSGGLANKLRCPEKELEVEYKWYFQDGFEGTWDIHSLGWIVALGAALVATVSGVFNICRHCRNYNKPLEQRQIVRILMMPPIYSLISFFAYWKLEKYVYFAIIRDTYEAFVLAAFLILCLLYVGRSPLEQHEVMQNKEKAVLPFPFCGFRFRPSRPHFLIATKWSVLQYVLFRPLISMTAIITNYKQVFCDASLSYRYANFWINLLTFLSATVALYGLLIIYHLAKDDLKGHRPLMKFLSIKIAVFLVFYQGFALSLANHLSHFESTEELTLGDTTDRLNALLTTVEMAAIGVVQIFAYPYSEYKAVIKGSGIKGSKSLWKNFLHSQDYRDFGRDIIISLKFFIYRLTGKLFTRSSYSPSYPANVMDFQAAFGLDRNHSRVKDTVVRQEARLSERFDARPSMDHKPLIVEPSLPPNVMSKEAHSRFTDGTHLYEGIRLNELDTEQGFKTTKDISEKERYGSECSSADRGEFDDKA